MDKQKLAHHLIEQGEDFLANFLVGLDADIVKIQERNAQLEAAVAEAREALKKNQHVELRDFDGETLYRACPECGVMDRVGHLEVCSIGRWLEKHGV